MTQPLARPSTRPALPRRNASANSTLTTSSRSSSSSSPNTNAPQCTSIALPAYTPFATPPLLSPNSAPTENEPSISSLPESYTSFSLDEINENFTAPDSSEELPPYTEADLPSGFYFSVQEVDCEENSKSSSTTRGRWWKRSKVKQWHAGDSRHGGVEETNKVSCQCSMCQWRLGRSGRRT